MSQASEEASEAGKHARPKLVANGCVGMHAHAVGGGGKQLVCHTPNGLRVVHSRCGPCAWGESLVPLLREGPIAVYIDEVAPRVESLEVAAHVGAVLRVVVEGAAHDAVEVCAGGPCVRFVRPGVPVPCQPLAFPDDRAIAPPRLDAVQEGVGRRGGDPSVAIVLGLHHGDPAWLAALVFAPARAAL